jgi:hypothetical protein
MREKKNIKPLGGGRGGEGSRMSHDDAVEMVNRTARDAAEEEGEKETPKHQIYMLSG